MEEIKTARSGIKYIPCTLKKGQRVYSQAILQRIPHNDLETVDITLKIGRYKMPFKSPETQEPRSELTLDNNELNALIDYLEQYYKPLEMNVDKFIKVKENAGELLTKLIETINDNNEIFEHIIKNEVLTKNLYVTVSLIKKKNAIAEFENMLSQDLLESKWQSWFTDNKWMFGSDYAHILDERKIDTDNIADYIMKAFDGFADLVEIKKPNNINFWASSLDHDNYVPSSDLIKAITQCLNYIYEIERESNSEKFIERLKCKIVKPRCILIFGRSNYWDDKQKKAYRILNASYNQISILTYDHILERAKSILGINSNPY